MFKKKNTNVKTHARSSTQNDQAESSKTWAAYPQTAFFTNPYINGQDAMGFQGISSLSGTQYPGFTRLGLAYDIFQEGEQIIIEIPFPGLVRESLTITQEDRFLRVIGTTFAEKGVASQERIMLQKQIPSGTFEQVIALPFDTQEDETQAIYDNGILTIMLKIEPSPKMKRVHASFQ